MSNTAITNNLQITKERVKAWHACTDGYRWFLEKFPQGGGFAEVYASLQSDKRYEDSGWLSDKVFAELDATAKVKQMVIITGADKVTIEKAAKIGDAAATTGYRANAATTGDWANAATTGHRANAATTGNHAVAASLGIGAKAKASKGGAIVLAHRNDYGELLQIRASKAGENGIKPDVFYTLNANGEFVECEE
jgi:hypothetical protein